MRNWLALNILCLLYLIPRAITAAPEDGVIIAQSVRLREKPDLNSQTITLLQQGEPVSVIGETSHFQEIGGVYDRWRQVRTTRGLAGWVFGAFVSTITVHLPDNTRLWATYAQPHGKCIGYNVFAFDLAHDTRLLFNAPLCPSFRAAFSPNGQYLAVDLGTDAVGQLSIFSVPQGNTVLEAIYSRTYLWDNSSCLVYAHVTEIADGCYFWREMKFCNGKTSPTGKTGQNPYHVYRKDKRCE